MSQHPVQYVFYTEPPRSQGINGATAVAPQETLVNQPQLQAQPPTLSNRPAPAQSTSGGPRIASGDWTKDLVHLAKTAELKKHALTLQLHTAHILAAHASLEQKSKTIQDIREQKNKLDSERNRLLEQLRQVNEDRDKADMMISSIEKECNDLRTQMNELTEGEYAVAKRDVDRLREELGQPPLPSLQNTMDEKNAQYLTDRRLNGQAPQDMTSTKRSVENTSAPQLNSPSGVVTASSSIVAPAPKRPRGRPRGSKNRTKSAEEA